MDHTLQMDCKHISFQENHRCYFLFALPTNNTSRCSARISLIQNKKEQKKIILLFVIFFFSLSARSEFTYDGETGVCVLPLNWMVVSGVFFLALGTGTVSFIARTFCSK